MSNNCHIQTGSCMLIGVPLTDTCEIVEGALVYTTAGIATLTGETERQEGTDYSAPNFGGALCGPQQKNDTIEKWLNITGEACLIDWSWQAATSGNPSVTDADGNVVGYAKLARSSAGACSGATKPRIAFVLARRAATDDGGCVAPSASTGATGIVGHFFPMTTNWLWDLPPFEDARASVPFQATGYTNPRIGAGPLNLWPATYNPNRVPDEAMHAQVFIDPASLPAVNCDEPLASPVPEDRTESA